MRKVFYLSTCNTCNRIIKELKLADAFELQNIREKPVTSKQLDLLYSMTGSYEALFSRRAQKYRSLGLNLKQLTEKDYRKWILEEYTFLKRPVIVIDDEIFIGNAKKVVESAAVKLAKLQS